MGLNLPITIRDKPVSEVGNVVRVQRGICRQSAISWKTQCQELAGNQGCSLCRVRAHSPVPQRAQEALDLGSGALC